MKSNSQRAIEAAQATNVAICTYPGYPDPTTHTGWADIPAVLLGVDLTGREDIEYTAMIGESISASITAPWLSLNPSMVNGSG